MASIRSVFSFHSLRGSNHGSGSGSGGSRSSPLRLTRFRIPNETDPSIHSQAPLATTDSEGGKVHAMIPWKSEEEEEEVNSVVKVHDRFDSRKEEV